MSKVKSQSLPHSWRVADWPDHVSPNRQAAARNLIRTHRADLIRHGALVRVGRDLWVIGEGYARFLSSKFGNTESFSCGVARTSSSAQPNQATP